MTDCPIGLSSGPWRCWTGELPAVLRGELVANRASLLCSPLGNEYRDVTESIHLARQIAAERGYGARKRKTPLPRNAPVYWGVLKYLHSPCFDLSRPDVIKCLSIAAEADDRRFFVALGAGLDPRKNPPASRDPIRFEHQFLIDNWLVLRGTNIELVEAGPPGPAFMCGVVPRTKQRMLAECRAIPARPKNEVPGFCWFDTKTIWRVFDEAFPSLPHHPSLKAWDRMIENLRLERMKSVKLSMTSIVEKPGVISVSCSLSRQAPLLAGVSLNFT